MLIRSMSRKAVVHAAALAGAAALAVSVAAPANAATHGSGTTHQAGATVKTVTPQQAAEAVTFAAQQIGKPFVMGANGPESFDSPGLTQAAYASVGVSIPRTSLEQWQRSTHLTASQVRKGDLVFFSDGNHVGIVADAAKHLVIHAPYPGTRVRYQDYDTIPNLTGFGRP
ncbi:hypothetical protein CTZ27_34620 [Streptomyces griseocarneus]|nr:hypothetical protein CTZ27_34620 [Streptomyces griseocarneus]